MKKQPDNCLSSSSLHIVHFNNGTGGGVFSVIKNLIQYSQNPAIENHIIYTINKEKVPVFVAEHITGAASQQVFYYSPKWNFYYTCRQLAKLIPDDRAVVVAHDWLELGMMSNLGLQNPVVFFLHGNYTYYYELSQKHEPAIDQFICVAKNIEVKLLTILPAREESITYLRFPVPFVFNNQQMKQDGSIIFIGRLTPEKGYHLVPLIAQKLREKNIEVNWHIVGSAANKKEKIEWDGNIPVKFYGNIPNNEVLELLKRMQILLLPSLAEGMPVTIIEAMKAGVIPIVNNIDGGIQELVFDNSTGYKIQNNSVSDYEIRISALMADKELAEQMRMNGIIYSNQLFDPVLNAQAIENRIVAMVGALKKSKQASKLIGSRLDEKWIPNWVTAGIRNFFT